MNKRERVVIVGGGLLGEWALQEIGDKDYVIGADRGAMFLIRHGIKPDLAVGDFDSVSEDERTLIRNQSREIAECDAFDKDLTDMEMAFDRAMAREGKEIVLLGALGTRMDHSLANVHLLRKGLSHGIPARIKDEHNEIRLIDRQAEIRQSRYPYISLLPLSLEVKGVTLEGFRYPLHRATLTLGQSLAVSNELAGKYGRITIEQGLLLVIQSKD